MTVAEDLKTLPSQSELEEIEFPPGYLESKEPPLETELHLRQILLLIQILEYFWQDRQDLYAFGNLTIYYSSEQKKTENFRGPDFFVVLNTQRKLRKSWDVIIELLSNLTANVDRTTKKEIYQDTFRNPKYFWFSPETLEFQGLEMIHGKYEEKQPNEHG